MHLLVFETSFCYIQSMVYWALSMSQLAQGISGVLKREHVFSTCI